MLITVTLHTIHMALLYGAVLQFRKNIQTTLRKVHQPIIVLGWPYYYAQNIHPTTHGFYSYERTFY